MSTNLCGQSMDNCRQQQLCTVFPSISGAVQNSSATGSAETQKNNNIKTREKSKIYDGALKRREDYIQGLQKSNFFLPETPPALPVYTTPQFSFAREQKRKFLPSEKVVISKMPNGRLQSASTYDMAYDATYQIKYPMHSTRLDTRGKHARHLRPCEDIHLKPPEALFPNGVSLNFFHIYIMTRQDTLKVRFYA